MSSDEWGRRYDIMGVMREEMERLLSHIAATKPPTVRFATCTWEPAIDVYETPTVIILHIELAGIRREDVELIIDRNTLLIRGERVEPPSEKGRLFHQMEIFCGPFQRQVVLPAAVDSDQAEASYSDGMLKVTLPKLTPSDTQRVNISSI